MLISILLLPGGPTYTTFRESGGLSTEGPTFLKAMTNYTVRVGSDVTFTCQVENITSYKVSKSESFWTKLTIQSHKIPRKSWTPVSLVSLKKETIHAMPYCHISYYPKSKLLNLDLILGDLGLELGLD